MRASRAAHWGNLHLQFREGANAFAQSLDRIRRLLTGRDPFTIEGLLSLRFLQTLTGSRGALTAFFNRPWSATLGMLCIALWLAPVLFGLRAKRRAS
jgi:hypothetical protein